VKKTSQDVDIQARSDWTTRLCYFKQRTDDIVRSIQQFVEIESPSDLKQAVDRLSTILSSRFQELGGRIKLHRETKYGNHLQIDFPGSRDQKPVLLLGHMDTVYPIGTISKMPSLARDGRVWGPGVFDMKSGIALMLAAIEGLHSWHGKCPRPITVLLVSDEEIGSKSSRHITEDLARRSEAVLVGEPAYGLQGAVKTARKGVGEYTLTVTGKAAHAGLEFEKGASAITEIARQIVEISKLVDLQRGITLNAGTIQGGTRVNVVAATATAVVDLRVQRMADAEEMDGKLRTLQPFDPDCKVELSGGINRPPMERTAGVAELYETAATLAKQSGWNLEEAAVGGGSDGNFTTALGIPTLDGLGAVGEGAHAENESVVISELPKRAALLAGLIETL
jgi:glutamate carboxypeptidase